MPAQPATGAQIGLFHPSAATAPMRLVVLASSSAGNCSVLIHGEGRTRRCTLIDAGLSPRRTRQLLHALALDLDRIDDILFTHLDGDHAHPGWIAALPKHARFRIHARQLGRARRDGFLVRRTELFKDQPFELPCGAAVRPVPLDAHDDLGVAAFRISPPGAAGDGPTLGFATDLGRVTDGLVSALRGVDVLAIESNYCPELQESSDRPEFLKRRIMDGSGHLSNQQSAQAVRAIGPRRGVVLLHLSRQCNTPERARAAHDHPGLHLTIAGHDQPTAPIDIRA
ncbi:MAG: MBL fold metallo-hydrolase [Phycisphaerales bacterium]|nr:MBL fold metallo-hydrolase [Phycisphaerales bacterium]